jgi:hypothetical protein
MKLCFSVATLVNSVYPRLRQTLSLGIDSIRCYNTVVEKTAIKFRNFADADKADREFYRKLSGQERLNILLELSKHEPERRLERVYRIAKLPRR